MPFRLIHMNVSKQPTFALTSILNYFCTQSRFTISFLTKYIHFFLINIRIQYVRSKTKDNPVELTNDSIRTTRFAHTNDLKILVHGVKGSRNDKFNTLLREGKYDR